MGGLTMMHLVGMICPTLLLLLNSPHCAHQTSLRYQQPALLLPPPAVKYATKNFSSHIDHFSFNPSLAKFSVRYLINDSFYSSGSPILFYTGNEGKIEGFAANTLIMWQLAPVLKAALVFVEHRYYGNSMPFGEHSMDNASTLAYLTAEQALADFAHFLSHLGQLEPRLAVKRSPVVAIGGSYGGMLAAWMRHKYPHLVCGALASSAPVRQFVNVTSCYAFMGAVTGAFWKASVNCSTNIRKSWDAIDRLAASGASGLASLSDAFATCQPLKAARPLKDWIVSAYVTAAMVNYPYPANFLLPLPAWPVAKMCQPLGGGLISQDLQLAKAVSAALQVYYNYTGAAACLNVSADPVGERLDSRGWSAQSCNEMVMPTSCSDGVRDMFQPTGDFNLAAYAAACQLQFGFAPRPRWAMTQFAGAFDAVACSNIFYANGDLDPWWPGGVPAAAAPNPSCPAVLIKGAAHHLDLRASDPRDPPDVTRVRSLQLAAVQRWIAQFRGLQ